MKKAEKSDYMVGFNSRFMTMSTSPRSPQRLPFYVSLLEPFSGKKWNKETQTEYYQSMISNQIGDFSIGKSKNPDLSARDKINRAPKALGLVKLTPNITITDPGKQIQNKYLFKDILIKQLLKYQLPSPLIPELSENKGMFNIKPYLELLRLVDVVGDLSRSEFYAFGVTMRDYHDFDNVVAALYKYREEAKSKKIHANKHYHDYMMQYISELYQDKIKANNVKVRESKSKSKEKFVKTKFQDIKDYGNAFLRYLTGTGLVIVNKHLQVVVAPDREDDVKYILNNISREATQYTEDEYNNLLFNTNEPQLLSDNKNALIGKIQQLNAQLSEFNIKTKPVSSELSSLNLKQIQYEKENQLENLARNEYAKSLKTYTQNEIDDVVETFEHIKAQDYFDNPLYLEWNTWRAITMIDNGDVQGAFKTNTNGDPVNTAPGNTADVIGNYGSFNMIVEVTMSTGKKQYEMENEPVMRHLGELRTKEHGKETFGIFIAKKIQPSLITEFYYKHRIPTSLYGGTVEFIPLTIDDFTNFFKNVTKTGHKLRKDDIYQIYKKTKEYANDATDEVDWYNNIRHYILNL